MEKNKMSKVYRVTMSILIGTMLASFFMPWMESTVGKERKSYHFIGFLGGGRVSSTSPESVYRMVNRSDHFFLILVSFIFFVFVVFLHLEATHEKKALVVLSDICIQCIYILPCICEFLTSYRDYYNKNHKGLYPMECHLKWGFFLYLILFFVTLVLGLIFGPRKNETMQKDNTIPNNKRLQKITEQIKGVLEFDSVRKICRSKKKIRDMASSIRNFDVSVQLTDRNAVYEIREWGKGNEYGDALRVANALTDLKKNARFVKTYYPDGCNLSRAYMLSDGKQIPIREAMTFVEQYFNKILSDITNDNMDIKVERVEVYEVMGTEQHIFVFYLSRRYEGLIFDTICKDPVTGKGYVKEDFKAVMTDTEDIQHYYFNQNYSNIEMISKEIDQILSPESALRFIYQKMGDYTAFLVCSIEMVYMRVETGDLSREVQDEQGECYGIPTWKVIAIHDESGTETEFYVDMQTGRLLE